MGSRTTVRTCVCATPRLCPVRKEEKEEEEEEREFIPLKPFGLCCYKTDPEIWEESDEAENARTAAMIDGAYAFLRSIEVIHPDYEFFSHHG